MTERERLEEILLKMPIYEFVGYDEASCDTVYDIKKMANYLLDNGVIVLPCKVGDRLWGIRRFHNTERVQEGIVNEMYFTKDMGLQIVIKSVCRGTFGEKIFLSREEAEAALKAREKE